MNILVACEESQTVCIELRKLGHRAYSCDIEKCSGGHPEWHVNDDAEYALKSKEMVYLENGKVVITPEKWDMILAFPPCTHLAVSGARYFEQKRKDGRQQQGIDFFMRFANLDCPRVAIENPIGVMSTYYRKPDQIIHPYHFGHLERKSTCLWLKGLPPLIPTNNVYDEMMKLPKNERERVHYLPPSADRAKIRSKTFLGIAKAMAEQWAGKE